MSLSTDNISSIYGSLYTNNLSASTSADSLKETIENKDYTSATSDELMDVCKEFEAYFVEQMYKTMQKMVPEDEDEDSSMASTMDYFGDMLTQEYAKNAASQGSLGIAEMLYEQMKRNYNIVDASDTININDTTAAESTIEIDK